MLGVFMGEKTHQIDDKNRIRIPSCFREMLGAKYVFKKGENGDIEVYTQEDAEALILGYKEELKGAKYDPILQLAFKELCKSFTPVNEDNQGRVVVPEDLVKYAGLKKDIVTTGVIDHLVISSVDKDVKEQEDMSFADAMEIIRQRIEENKNGI